MVINEVFRGPVLDVPLAGMATLAEACRREYRASWLSWMMPP